MAGTPTLLRKRKQPKEGPLAHPDLFSLATGPSLLTHTSPVIKMKNLATPHPQLLLHLDSTPQHGSWKVSLTVSNPSFTPLYLLLPPQGWSQGQLSTTQDTWNLTLKQQHGCLVTPSSTPPLCWPCRAPPPCWPGSSSRRDHSPPWPSRDPRFQTPSPQRRLTSYYPAVDPETQMPTRNCHLGISRASQNQHV